MQGCQFCTLVRDGRSRHFSAVMGNDDFAEVLGRNGDLLVIPDVAPCRTGHMLMVARDHRLALLNLWRSTAADAIVNRVEDCLPEGERLIIFEHGIVAENAKPSCVEHAHAHLIPANGRVLTHLESELGPMTEIDGPEDLNLRDDADEYALLRDHDGRWFRAQINQIPGQAIRRAMLGSHPRTHWNWLDYVEFAGTLDTRQLILAGTPLFERVRSALT